MKWVFIAKETRSVPTHQQVKNFINIFSTDLNAIDLQNFIPFMQQPTLLCSSSLDDATDDNRIHFIANSSALCSSNTFWICYI